jgi:DNA-binding transcriptional LysR family regulator
MILEGSPGDLIDEGIDIAIFLGALDDTSMVARKLASSSLIVCGSPDYLSQHGVPQTPEDLAEHSCLVNWAIAPRNKWQFKGDAGYKVVTVSGRMQANAAHPIRIAAINGLGLVMLPSYIVGKDIENGTLKVVLENYPLPPLDIHAVYPHRKYLSAKVKGFMDFLQAWLEHRVSMPGTE